MHAILGCPRNVAGNQTKTGSQVVSLHHVASHRVETSSAQNCPQPELGKDAEIDENWDEARHRRRTPGHLQGWGKSLWGHVPNSGPGWTGTGLHGNTGRRGWCIPRSAGRLPRACIEILIKACWGRSPPGEEECSNGAQITQDSVEAFGFIEPRKSLGAFLRREFALEKLLFWEENVEKGLNRK